MRSCWIVIIKKKNYRVFNIKFYQAILDDLIPRASSSFFFLIRLSRLYKVVSLVNIRNIITWLRYFRQILKNLIYLRFTPDSPHYAACVCVFSFFLNTRKSFELKYCKAASADTPRIHLGPLFDILLLLEQGVYIIQWDREWSTLNW